MKNRKLFVGIMVFLIVCSLTVYIFMQVPVVNAKQPVTRPFKIQSQLTLLDYPNSPTAAIDQGVASELGDYIGVGKWISDFEGFGIIYASNGDQIFWETTDGGANVVFTDGTGRFQNVSGGYAGYITDMFPIAGPSGSTSIIFSYEGEGTITY